MSPERERALLAALDGTRGHNKARDILVRAGSHPLGFAPVEHESPIIGALERWGLVSRSPVRAAGMSIVEITPDGRRVYSLMRAASI